MGTTVKGLDLPLERPTSITYSLTNTSRKIDSELWNSMKKAQKFKIEWKWWTIKLLSGLQCKIEPCKHSKAPLA